MEVDKGGCYCNPQLVEVVEEKVEKEVEGVSEYGRGRGVGVWDVEILVGGEE